MKRGLLALCLALVFIVQSGRHKREQAFEPDYFSVFYYLGSLRAQPTGT